jgi:hypothetical protein
MVHRSPVLPPPAIAAPHRQKLVARGGEIERPVAAHPRQPSINDGDPFETEEDYTMSEPETIKVPVQANAPVQAVNDSDTELIFSVFNARDNFIPYYHTTIEPHGKKPLEVGGFELVGIGVQVQSGGRWIGGDPKDEPFCKPGQTFTFTAKRSVS